MSNLAELARPLGGSFLATLTKEQNVTIEVMHQRSLLRLGKPPNDRASGEAVHPGVHLALGIRRLL